MMLAKFSGSSISTQISSGTAPATSRGTQGEQHVGDPAQRHPEQQRNRQQRPATGLDEGLNHGVAGFEDRDRPAARHRFGRRVLRGKFAQRIVVVRVAARQRLDSRLAVLGLPVSDQFGRRASPG